MLNPDLLLSLLPETCQRLYIAYSGGVDSHVLLHLAASTPELKTKITAVYVHHGLQHEADSWDKHNRTIADKLGVKYRNLNVNIVKQSARSLEELAREARYQALQELLAEGDALFLAHHREDQMETMLLQLFRGAGLSGLAAMPETKVLGLGIMYRPFLQLAKQQIMDYASSNSLQWVEDPSNQQDDFDRNFLRNQILPKLKQKWPAIDQTVARSARHCAEALQLSETMAVDLLMPLLDKTGRRLDLMALSTFDRVRQKLLIRQWLKHNGYRMPSEKRLNSIFTNAIEADTAANPELVGPGYTIRRFRDGLYCLAKEQDALVLVARDWQKGDEKLQLDDGNVLTLKPCSEGIAQSIWQSARVQVRYRQGAEKIRLPGRSGSHSLKKLYQELGIPPWQRQQIPLIYLDDQLAAVADIFCSAEFFRRNEVCYQINWLRPGTIV